MARHGGAELIENLQQHTHIPDAGHVVEHTGVAGEQAGRYQRQRGVLVAFDLDGAGQWGAADDAQGRHL